MIKKSKIDEFQFPQAITEALIEMRETKSVGTIYPWPDMSVGDSVLFQAEGNESIRVLRRRVGVSVYNYGKVSGKQFTTKLLPDENGFRVWRTD